jgi:prolyl 4-hydroxylase
MSTRAEGDPGALYRMQIGAFVSERLLRTPNTLKLPALGLDIFVVREFLSPKECADVIELIDKDRVPSGLLAPTPDPEFRTSESCNLRLEDRANQMVEGKINRLTGIDPRHGETIQGQRYAVGQQFKPHHDFFFTNQPYWPEQERQGGQRTWTAMIFLNAPEAGGQTFFPNAKVRVSPTATRSTPACRSKAGSNMSSPNGIGSGPGAGTPSTASSWPGPIERTKFLPRISEGGQMSGRKLPLLPPPPTGR